MAESFGLHENYSTSEPHGGSSDRGFGFVFAGVFAIIGCWPLIHKLPVRLWALVCSGCFLLLALAAPKILRPLNRAWTWFSLQLAKVTNPVFTGLMFFVLFTPAALILRLLGKDLLRLNGGGPEGSYWVQRTPPGPAADTMKNQF